MSVPERLAAALADRYTIERELGQGGMAKVYLAEDMKHDRRVAIKVLKPELAAVVGGDRFVTEIKTTANLQHPHILPLFDSGQADGFLFYVMPYVEGETLRDKLDREKQLSVAEAIAITVKVAGALQAAHDRGVIHRDIKPANVLLQNGEPVVADFGIALAVQQAGEGRITETGLSLGTPYYMAPEQATGDRDPDARSDLYSVACMLYEMLTGEPPFHGTTAQAVLGRILTQPPPDVTQARPSVPPHIGMILTKALQKLPADRFESVAEFSRALQNERYVDSAMMASGAWTAAHGAGGSKLARMLPWGVAAVMTLVAVGLGVWPAAPESAPVPTMARVTGIGMAVTDLGGARFTISPDGRMIVVAGQAEGDEGSRLFVRPAGEIEWRPLPNTEGARNPTFSPDSRFVAFDLLAGGGIFRVPIDGGAALPVADSGAVPHWGLDGTIVFMRGPELMRVPGSGGDPVLLLANAPGGISRPHILPDGSGVLFSGFAGGDPLSARVSLLDIESGEVREIAASGNRPTYVRTGHVLYGHGSQSLMAVPFDLRTREIGSPTTVIPELSVFSGGAAQYAVAAETGTLLYNARAVAVGGAQSRSLSEISLLDGTVSSLDLAPGELSGPRYSPDGRRIAYQDAQRVRVFDVATGASPDVAGEDGIYPVWGARGDYLYYSRTNGGSPTSPARRRSDSSTPPELLLTSEAPTHVRAVLPGSEGDSIILLRQNHPDRGRDLLFLRLGPGGELPQDPVAEPYLTADWNESGAELSPDGRYAAYLSDQDGEPRVYVQDFPRPSGARVVSAGQGTDPRWAPDGESIYYRNGTTFFEVDVTLEPSFSVGATREVLREPRYLSRRPGLPSNYDLHPDGNRLLLVLAADAESGAGAEYDPVAAGDVLEDLYIVTNWFTRLLEVTGGGGR
jgi:serine/threonine-protein kinase